MTFVTLNECPPGLFRTEDGTYGFKSEYSTTTVDAYCLESGEYFWGGATNAEERGALKVEPVDFLAQIKAAEAEAARHAANLDNEKAAHDRTRERLKDAEAAKRDAENQKRFFESRASSAEKRMEQAQGTAMELRGRLLELKANQMIRRGDLSDPRLPDAYDDGVPF
ncbi:hypothetical protein [Sphingobium sp. CFD-2]|uniref:hypothetical protein n=1 Tax=Sphingobium sp. CFD-2 TaxID=2878542 RepID=UPI00214C592B|nr:hypothetical protein [Sphingobium sp. CFD-2]